MHDNNEEDCMLLVAANFSFSGHNGDDVMIPTSSYTQRRRRPPGLAVIINQPTHAPKWLSISAPWRLL
ncbi:hypothetical protein MLD38_037428 [Melastoma candidum]|uniref:Uncharacterized protein n=1 Tax=Melastoma candidum TaxID=119954 RepID=A0ACB9LMT3_9MYRT|nr:hypothetical protein MLD38_037428 [Melastoma candidum]